MRHTLALGLALLLLSVLCSRQPASASTSEPHGASAPLAAAAPVAVPAEVPSDEPPASLPFAPTVDDVLSWMAKAPATEFATKPYPRWAKTGQANRIAKAIADHAESREEAGDATLYALFESGNVVTAAGDGGKSHGPWQLSEDHASRDVAQDPDKAIVVWLALARKSRLDCSKLPDDEQLAELASGSCDKGRSLARRRARLRARILAEVGGE